MAVYFDPRAVESSLTMPWAQAWWLQHRESTRWHMSQWGDDFWASALDHHHASQLNAASWHRGGVGRWGQQAPWKRSVRPMRSFPVVPEEPGDVLLVNSESSGAYVSLCAIAAEADLVAFDAEWRPDWHKGSDNPVSVLQLAFPNSGRVYVLQLGKIGNRLPTEVQMMLVNPGVIKVGFAVGQKDMDKLSRSGIALTRGSVVDVQEKCATVMRLTDPPETLSLKRAAASILGFQLAKDKRCSCSDWASEILTPEQIRYAALDAWVALRLYYETS
eukprot:TRINITY_DN68151_c0_g1_i1.p1 TRINITY_DN68151_c0_g1~~TRINITY_DN68151_c0_g1_i1.p1  ORF type:complete len:309 (+),score=34.39 TRINITY_DN68151_c0_g1_i1:106-927(+)